MIHVQEKDIMHTSASKTRTASSAALLLASACFVATTTTVAAFSNNNNNFGYYRHAALPRRSSVQQKIRIFNDDDSPFPKSYQHLLKHEISTACKSTANSDDENDTALTINSSSALSAADIKHMKKATSLARIGYGNTFPNPAVGCVLVRHNNEDEEDTVIGSGFHPKAGMPHAEVFALFEACGHVTDGVAAAKSVMGIDDNNEELEKQVSDLLTIYKSQDGASKLFASHFVNDDVTAYVTLEPCCHVGQTPPCATSLVMAGVNRVVVGYRDPNPRVDGGGICVLEDAGVDVHVIGKKNNGMEMEAAKECSDLVKYFVKRISPREDGEEDLDDVINGKKRRILRSIAGRQKSSGTIQQVELPKDKSSSSIPTDGKTIDEIANSIPIHHRNLEVIDRYLWDHEVVLLRLNNIVQKKKGAKIVGGRIAEALNAHVAQVIGHTVLLYRPGFPPVLDLEELVLASGNDDAEDDG